MDNAGTKTNKASVTPWPNPKIIGSKISVFIGFKNILLKINLKPSSNTPAENAIKIPVSRGFRI